jgi:hypothetical protein
MADGTDCAAGWATPTRGNRSSSTAMAVRQHSARPDAAHRRTGGDDPARSREGATGRRDDRPGTVEVVPLRPRGPIGSRGAGMTTIQRSVVALAASVALSVTIWAVTSGPATEVARTTGPPPATHSVVLDNQSDGSSKVVARGARLTVDLVGRDAMRWSTIVVSPPGNVLIRQSSSQAPNGSSTAVFLASAQGRATLTSTGRPVCTAGLACPQYILLWRVSVVVDGG